MLAPGFVDIHTHVDFTLPRYPRAQSMVRQGVTTLVGGNCGFSPFPVAEATGAAVQLSHHKAMGHDNWGSVDCTLAMIDAARDRGLDVAADRYPYVAASTTLSALLPDWVRNDGLDGMLAILSDTDTRAELARAVTDRASDSALDEVMISAVTDGPNAAAAGRMLVDIARAAGEHLIDTVFCLLAEERDRVQMVVFGMDERHVRTVMSHPWVAVASDGWTLDPAEGGVPHPRSYGAYARVFGRYVREHGVLTLEDAVRGMTSLPASRCGLPDRGVIRVGARADLVALDPQRVIDRATFTAPHRFAIGVHHVIVNGRLVLEDGDDTGADAGPVLRAGR